MIQSNIILTQTFIDETKLSQIVANSFFTTGLFLPELLENISVDDDFNWEKYLSGKQVIQMDFKDKDDFKDSLNGIYQNYQSPIILFLGDLNKYSTALQEGMLRLLEEPPKNLFIVLFAQSKSEILPTIASRSRFFNLPKSLVMKILNQKLLEKVKKKLPPIADFAKNLVVENTFDIPDLKKIEREEVSFWLWQISCYLEQYYLAKPSLKVAEKISKVLEAQKLNSDNLQKKLVVSWIKFT